jgi:hypothetical protein
MNLHKSTPPPPPYSKHSALERERIGSTVGERNANIPIYSRIDTIRPLYVLRTQSSFIDWLPQCTDNNNEQTLHEIIEFNN